MRTNKLPPSINSTTCTVSLHTFHTHINPELDDQLAMATAAAAAVRSYVDFMPPHRLLEEPDKETLRIDLSDAGFKKEQLRVQIDGSGRLRISGERHVAGNQWSRFRKEFHVPEGCNAGKIRAMFDKGGVLHVVMPKLSPAAAEEPKATDAKTSEDQKTAAGYSAASQQQHAAEAEEEDGTKRHDQEEEEHTDGRDGEGAPAPTSRLAFGGMVRGRSRKMASTVLLAVVVALLVGAGLYAKYMLMDSSVELAPAYGDHFDGFSDY